MWYLFCPVSDSTGIYLEREIWTERVSYFQILKGEFTKYYFSLNVHEKDPEQGYNPDPECLPVSGHIIIYASCANSGNQNCHNCLGADIEFLRILSIEVGGHYR